MLVGDVIDDEEVETALFFWRSPEIAIGLERRIIPCKNTCIAARTWASPERVSWLTLPAARDI
jgi:hypothetical protein